MSDLGEDPVWRAGAREMREAAAEAAQAAYPDPDAMMRAIHALPIDAVAGAREGEVTVEVHSNGIVDLAQGRARTRLRGGTLARILAVHRHMRKTSHALAQAYLSGVLDGIGHAAARALEDAIAGKRKGE